MDNSNLYRINQIVDDNEHKVSLFAYSGKTAHPFQRNGAPFRLKLSKAQLVN